MQLRGSSIKKCLVQSKHYRKRPTKKQGSPLVGGEPHLPTHFFVASILLCAFEPVSPHSPLLSKYPNQRAVGVKRHERVQKIVLSTIPPSEGMGFGSASDTHCMVRSISWRSKWRDPKQLFALFVAPDVPNYPARRDACTQRSLCAPFGTPCVY